MESTVVVQKSYVYGWPTCFVEGPAHNHIRSLDEKEPEARTALAQKGGVTMNVKTGFLTGLSLAAVALALAMVPAAASHVEPTSVDGNPSCTDLGYGFGFKLDPPTPGTYAIDGFGMLTVASDGTYFDWTSTVGVDAVIVKGGPNSNVYVYDPPAEAFIDTGLHSPINPNDRRPYQLTYELSHIEFCSDYNLDVEKTAEASRTLTYGWTIDKSVTPETWDLFTGDTGTSEYTVSVTKDDGTLGPWVVSGTITIENNTPLDATIESVSDVISGVGPVAVDCGVDFPYLLASGATLECTYSTEVPDGSDRTNTATAHTSGPVDGGSATAAVVFGGPTLVNDAISVDDTLEGSLGTFDDDDTVRYERTFECDGDVGTQNNTATIVETGQSDSASVQVNCFALTVAKDATTSFHGSWDWTIDKSADQTQLLLSEGQLFEVNYQVEVIALAAAGSDFGVSGSISVYNPAPMDAYLNSISDLVSPDIVANVDCGVTFPYVLTAGGTLNCTYSTVLPNGHDRLNTATATLQNYDYDRYGLGSLGGTTDFLGTADVTFGDALDGGPDACVDVFDTNVGFLGTVCASEAPEIFDYSLGFGARPDAQVVLVCGDNSHVNTASFVTNDSGAAGSDDWTVSARVTCEQVSDGCTLTPGYWKTHSEYGPAPFDDTWDLVLPAGEDTQFFLSEQTYNEVLWIEPEGNAYYILAHAYIAAQLNMLDGADFTDAQAAFDEATVLFNTYTPEQIAALGADDPTRQLFITLAGILDDYNNGLAGPGHCSE